MKSNSLMHQNQDQQGIIDRVMSINLDGPKHKLIVEKRWSLNKADNAEIGYKGFLVISAIHSDKKIVPTKIIDEMWHMHILDTSAYIKDCQKIFGYYLHHFPYFGMRGEEDYKNLSNAFEETRRLFIGELGFDPLRPKSVKSIMRTFKIKNLSKLEGANKCL